MPPPLTHAERRAAGLRSRKQLPRSAHAGFSERARTIDPLTTLRNAQAGRIPELVTIKYQRMAGSPFGFFRGAACLMAADLAAQPNTGIVTQLCGDAHVLNLGAYAAPDGRLVFDINDFDESLPGPFEWDLKRLATSLLLAGREAGIRRAARRQAVEVFAERYRHSMQQFAAMPVLELAHYQVHRLRHMAPIARVLQAAERSTPQRLVAKLTEAVPGKQPRGAAGSGERRFLNKPPLLYPVPEPEARLVLDSLTSYAETLQPERRHFLAQYRPLEVGFKVVGTGSVGLRDYCIYFESARSPEPGSDPLFLQVKEEPASAYAPYLPKAAEAYTHQGHRVVDGQRALQFTSDPFLGYTSLEGRDYLVRQLNDHKAGLDLATLCAADLRAYAELCGELFARGHARAGDPVQIASYLGESTRFDKALIAFARAYADQTEKDHKLLVRWLRHAGASSAVKLKPAS